MFVENASYLFASLFITLALLGMGCEHAGPLELELEQEQEEEEGPTWTGIQASIMNTNCALSGCHQGPSALLGLDLSEGNSYSSLVGVRSKEVPDLFLVDPGFPEKSYLIAKLEGSAAIAPGTLQMPIGRPALSAEAIDEVRSWIAEGAQNN